MLFADSSENTVSINIGGQESELKFYEADPQNVNSFINIFNSAFIFDERSLCFLC